MFNLFRHCRKDEITFDIVAETGNIVAKNGNNVEATFDTVARIVQLVAFDNVASTLLLVWTGLKTTNISTRERAALHERRKNSSSVVVSQTITASAVIAATINNNAIKAVVAVYPLPQPSHSIPRETYVAPPLCY